MTDPKLSEEKLRELVELADKATDGTWRLQVCNSGEACWCRWIAVTPKTEDGKDYIVGDGACGSNDAAFIAAANPQVVKQMARELREARGLLSEAADWLCEHAEAREAWAEGTGRAWCSDCHNYLRSDADATLKDRIRALLPAEPGKDEGGGDAL